jgi:C-terminal processing protease CtpA/Prc
MLAYAKDAHVRVKVNGKPLKVFRWRANPNYNMDIIKKTVPNFKEMSKYVFMGQFDNNIGYILITSWTRNEPGQVVEPALKALKILSDTSALIIDIRPNGGGSESLAQTFAGCFIEKPVVYAKHKNRNTNAENGWTDVISRKLRVNNKQTRYKGKIVVLMGNVNMSSCEAFILMMKQVPNCTLIGSRSYGSSGNPKTFDLGNGVAVDLPSWKVLRMDETCFEGKGIEPNMKVATNEKILKTTDRVLNFALKYLRNKS